MISELVQRIKAKATASCSRKWLGTSWPTTARDVSEQTVYRYRRYLGDHVERLKREGLALTMDQLQGQRGYRLLKQYLAHLRDERGLAHGTVATAYSILRTFWN